MNKESALLTIISLLSLILVLFILAGCATSPNQCTWIQEDGHNGHWYSKCVLPNQRK